ncbi:MAG TPA: hypothetical protein VLE89_01915 [Chlamydiales bacterium]|nr:hypothetical protein [Chlamydiales bacterium]
MAAQAIVQKPVQSIAELSQEEVIRYSAFWLKLEAKLKGNVRVPKGLLPDILEVAAARVNELALQERLFSDPSVCARTITINIFDPETQKGRIVREHIVSDVDVLASKV